MLHTLYLQSFLTVYKLIILFAISLSTFPSVCTEENITAVHHSHKEMLLLLQSLTVPLHLQTQAGLDTSHTSPYA